MGMKPSKALPSTGLKRNTQEWKDNHPEAARRNSEERVRRARGEEVEAGKKEGRSRASSSSSIPSLATKGEDERTDAEKAQAQEGARGRGPGAHEAEIPQKEGWLSGLLNSAFGTGTTEEPASQETSDGTRTWVDSPSSEYQQGEAFAAPPSALGGPSAGSSSANKEAGSDDKSEKKDGGKQKKASEEYEGRDSERERKLTDEAGRRPHGLPPVKKEEKPGPRTEIVLDPRISHMHVSRHILCVHSLSLCLSRPSFLPRFKSSIKLRSNEADLPVPPATRVHPLRPPKRPHPQSLRRRRV